MRPLAQWPAQQRAQVRGVFTDIDDTLSRDGAITPDARAALDALRAAGIRVIATTGRPIGGCLKHLDGTHGTPWPVDAIVAENGALAWVVARDANGPTGAPPVKIYQQSAEDRAAQWTRMQAVAQRVLHEIPGVALTRDMPLRETDLTFDHGEFCQLDADTIARVVALLQSEGMQTSVSSIHIHGCYNPFDKWQGARWILQALEGLHDSALEAELAHWACIGDSGNDQALFQNFRHSVGVANILTHAHRMQTFPRYVTQASHGSGFAEMAAALIDARSRPGMGLLAMFTATFLSLVGYFMLSPMLLLRLKGADVSTTLAGLYVATGWLGTLLMTPFASSVAHRLGLRQTLRLAGALLTMCAGIYLTTDALAIWFFCNLVSGMAMALRWVLAEALIAEFCPPAQRGRYVGLFQTMIGSTFIIGPAAMAARGPTHPATGWLMMAFTVAGLLWTFFIPPVPDAHDAGTAQIGLRGLWGALQSHTIIMLAGFTGGFFETGLTSILPLYGLELGMDARAATALIAISSAGGMAISIPAGMLTDRFADPAHGRRTLLSALSGALLLVTCAMPWVAQWIWLSGPMVFLWGGIGGALYTLCITDIGAREKGITLVNSTAVLVLTYTLGGLIASGLCGALIDWSARVALPAVLMLVAGVSCVAVLRSHRATQALKS